MKYINIIKDGFGIERKYFIEETEENISIQDNSCNREILKYKKVNKIMSHWKIWNIGNLMGHDEYLPLFCNQTPQICGSLYEVDINTLKAIKLPKEEIKILREAASVGCRNLETVDCIDDKKLRMLAKKILKRITK